MNSTLGTQMADVMASPSTMHTTSACCPGEGIGSWGHMHRDCMHDVA